MINRLALTNFKSIGKTLIDSDEGIKEGKLDFAPLTIFCGKNSSGKSTVLQSILLLVQTLQNNNPKETLVLNGPMVKLGGVDDIKSEFNTLNNISIDIDFFVPETNKEFNFALKYKENYLSAKQIGCIKEEILLEELNKIFEYNLSNDLEQIEKAIYSETGSMINLEKASWIINQNLSKNVKELMNKHKVIYSMTTQKNKDIQYLWVNKHIDDKWFISTFTVINDIILSEDELQQASKNPDILLKKASKINKRRINRNTNLYLSFLNKKANDISNVIPIIEQFHFKDEYKINNYPHLVNFTALHTTKYKNIITQDNDFERFSFNLDDNTKKLIKDQKLIGLRMNHFLPKEFVYVFKRTDIISNFMINSLKTQYLKYLEKEYIFTDQSVKIYNNNIRSLLYIINKQITDKKIDVFIPDNIEINDEILFNQFKKNKIDISNIFIPDNIVKNDEKLFKKYVGKSIIGLNKIKKLLSNIVSSSYDNENKSLDPELDNNYKFPYIVQTDTLGLYIQDSITKMKNYFQNNFSYIGPLREEPHLQYEAYIENIKNIGTKGENCAGLLYHNKKKVVKDITPKYIEENNQKLKFKYSTLFDSLNEWLRYIGIADSIIANFNGRYGYELKIKPIDNKKNNDLTNVGVGVSQVLPIVLACLLAPEYSTIIIEQPELHLHPAMQSKLTDFFVAMMLCNKQLIIETHSEYIINRLRLRAINLSTEKPINDLINIYFTENIKEDKNNYKKGNTLFRPININEYGAISDWPEGFFDESSENADEIFNAASLKWKQKQEKDDD